MRFEIRAICGLVLWMALASSIAAEPDPAERPVVALHRALLDTMREGDSSGVQSMRAQLEETLDAVFDFEFIARLVLAEHWDPLDERDRSRMVAAMRALTVSSYAHNFTDHSGETFEIREVREARRGRKLVRSVMQRPGEPAVSFDYLVHDVSGNWRIINVIAEGVSDLALKQTQYRSVMKARGLQGVLDEINRQVAELSAGA